MISSVIRLGTAGLVVTLLGSTALGDLEDTRLPIARATKPMPEPLPPLVRITREAVYVEGRLAGKSELLAKAGQWDAPWLEGKLRGAKVNAGEVIVFAVEPEVPYRIVKKTLFHANKAGFVKVVFAVRDAESADVVVLDLKEGGAGSRTRGVRIADVDPWATPIMGSLDPALIDAIIKRDLAVLKRCYDKELYRTPALAGKMVVNFTIGADGIVTQSKIKSSTMNSEPVESCVTARFMELVFPKPNGGGIVNVNYPLMFSSSGY